MTDSMKQMEVLRRASLFLREHDREAMVAQVLLEHYLGVSRAAFYARMQETVPPDVVAKLDSAIRQHVDTGIPVQHLIGYVHFYGYDFHVNGDVLIPRPETEELVDHVLTIMRHQERELTVVDVGTGSGVIAIILALLYKRATVYATDISEKALAVAEKNAADLQANVTFLHGNLLEPLIDRNIEADIIVSNPPYIAMDEKSELQDTVRDYDPGLALFADDSGLAIYSEIAAQLEHVCRRRCTVAFEIGHMQGQAVWNMLEKSLPGSTPHIKQDINGKDRIVIAER